MNESNLHGRLWDRDLDRLPNSSHAKTKGDQGPAARRAMRLPLPWTVSATIATLIGVVFLLGLVLGSPRMVGASLAALAVAPLVLTLYVLGRNLGPNTLFR